jgi:hypothetical protein
MRADQLYLRCFADRREGQWQAFCLDLSLVAQADTFEEARDKLDRMICDYVYDAMAGEDRQYADQLIPRRAPLRDWLKYYVYWLRVKLRSLPEQGARLFKELLPLQPSDRCHHQA